MPIEFDCPECGEHLSLWDELAGKQGVCPKCNAGITVPGAEGDVFMACPRCDAEIPAGSKICTSCGVDLKHGTKLETKVNEPGAVEQVARESADAIVNLLWRFKFIILGLVVFFALMLFIFSRASKGSIGPDLRQLDREAQGE